MIRVQQTAVHNRGAFIARPWIAPSSLQLLRRKICPAHVEAAKIELACGESRQHKPIPLVGQVSSGVVKRGAPGLYFFSQLPVAGVNQFGADF